MEQFLALVDEYKHILFSGAGVALVGGVIHLIFKRRSHSSSQSIRSGDSSTNIQAGRDANIKMKRKDVE